jgi:hypothetical protein
MRDQWRSIPCCKYSHLNTKLFIMYTCNITTSLNSTCSCKKVVFMKIISKAILHRPVHFSHFVVCTNGKKRDTWGQYSSRAPLILHCNTLYFTCTPLYFTCTLLYSAVLHLDSTVLRFYFTVLYLYSNKTPLYSTWPPLYSDSTPKFPWSE